MNSRFWISIFESYWQVGWWLEKSEAGDCDHTQPHAYPRTFAHKHLHTPVQVTICAVIPLKFDFRLFEGSTLYWWLNQQQMLYWNRNGSSSSSLCLYSKIPSTCLGKHCGVRFKFALLLSVAYCCCCHYYYYSYYYWIISEIN